MLIPPGLHSALWDFFIVLQTIVTLLVLTEGVSSISRASRSRKEIRSAALKGFPIDETAPKIDLIYPCYLPNEQDIILTRIRYALREIKYPKNRLTFWFLYNTPVEIPLLEDQMKSLETSHQQLRVIKVAGSKSKADNINYFLNKIPNTGSDIISIFDADHYPDADNLMWVATRFLKGDVDIVQGRSCVYNYSETWLSKLVAAEFDTIYGVSGVKYFHSSKAYSLIYLSMRCWLFIL